MNNKINTNKSIHLASILCFTVFLTVGCGDLLEEIENAETTGASAAANSAADKFLTESAQKGDLEDIKTQIENGASVDAKGPKSLGGRHTGDPAIMIAAHYNRKEVIELLIAEGADVDASNGLGGFFTHNALQSAVSEGNMDIIKILLEAGADINSWSSTGKTALDFSLGSGDMNRHKDDKEYKHREDVTKYLKEQGAKTRDEFAAEYRKDGLAFPPEE